jgi:phosphatidylglycerol lysyltransferase
MRERLLNAIGPALGLTLLAVALAILHRELQHYRLADIVAHLHAIPPRTVATALGLSVLGYLALTGYDTLAFRWIGNRLAYPRIALASFLGYVFSHNIGLSFFGGSAVRYRILTSFGVKPGEIARVIAFNLATFWLGFLLLAGVALTLEPLAMPGPLRAYVASTRPVGCALLALLVAYLVWSALRRTPVEVRGFEVRVPGPVMTAAQITVSAVDWILAAAVLWVLLPPAPGLSFPIFLGIYLVGQVAGIASHVPAGLGVFESAAVLMLAPFLPGDVVLASVFAYRVVYYLVPMTLAVSLFAGHEAWLRRRRFGRAQAIVEQWAPAVVPRIFAATTSIAGVILLVSGATPAAPGRLPALARVLPLPVIEISHFLGSLIGVGLLLLARALQQRVDAGYYLTLALLAAGSAASLAKGFDYEEASVLAAMFVALAPCRSFFYRKSALLGQVFSVRWMVGVAFVLTGVLILTGLAYRHVDYANELWWRFELSANVSRSLRALVGAAALLAAFFLARLLRAVRPVSGPPSAAELERVRPLVAQAPRASAHLALLGDKPLLFHEDGDAFLMYGVAGRTWVSMGDPVGPPAKRRELAWRFRELADEHGGRAVFYEVGEADLSTYVEIGLSFRKLGEEARVSLETFGLSGRGRQDLRTARNRLERDGYRFELLPPEVVPSLLDALAAISDEWLAEKRTREKRFSLGFFDRAYLKRLPLAVVRRGDRLVAFANVWLGGEKEELSIDLMRHGRDAPPGVMDYLFSELMLWGKDQGYRWFSLGMAPFSGFESHRLAPLWNRAAALLFRYGEPFYNFRGLRSFKEKFDPVWEPRFLAYPDGVPAPLVMTRIAALTSGGVTGAVAK